MLSHNLAKFLQKFSAPCCSLDAFRRSQWRRKQCLNQFLCKNPHNPPRKSKSIGRSFDHKFNQNQSSIRAINRAIRSVEKSELSTTMSSTQKIESKTKVLQSNNSIKSERLMRRPVFQCRRLKTISLKSRNHSISKGNFWNRREKCLIKKNKDLD